MSVNHVHQFMSKGAKLLLVSKNSDENDLTNFENIKDLNIEYWHPTKRLPIQTGAFNPSFLRISVINIWQLME